MLEPPMEETPIWLVLPLLFLSEIFLSRPWKLAWKKLLLKLEESPV
jgi:hypothetical protein